MMRSPRMVLVVIVIASWKAGVVDSAVPGVETAAVAFGKELVAEPLKVISSSVQ